MVLQSVRKPFSQQACALLWWAQSSGYPIGGDSVRRLLYDTSFNNIII